MSSADSLPQLAVDGRASSRAMRPLLGARIDRVLDYIAVGGPRALAVLAGLALGIAALVAVGWPGTLADIALAYSAILAVCAAALAFGAALLWRANRVVGRERQAMEDARASEARAALKHHNLVEALDALPVGLALYDAEERLVAYNGPYNRMIQHVGGLDESMIGHTYEQVVTHLEHQVRVVFPGRDFTNWKSEYLRRFRERESTDLLWENGQTMRLAQVPTPSGGTVLLRMDVTDLKRSEQEARAAQRRFDLLVNSLSDTVFSTDRSGRFNYVSGAMTQLMGYTPDELLGQYPHVLVHPDDRSRLEDCIVRLGRHRGVPQTFSHRGLHKDGTVRQIEVRMAAPEKGETGGGEFAVTGVMRDVQAQHEMEERLRYELQRLDSVVQSSGAAIVLVDRDMHIIMANKGFLNSGTARSAAQVIGRPLHDFVKSPIDRAVFDSWFAAGPGEPLSAIEYETSMVDDKGRRHVHHVTANPVRDDSGKVQHVVFLAVDHTERRAAEMQLFNSSRLATVGEMASGVAHEINQPLTIIRFAAESLVEQLQTTPPATALADAAEVIDAKLSRIIAQTERAATIIQELKGFARRPDETPRPFDVSDTLRAASQMLSEQLRLSGVHQQLDLEAGCPPVLGSSSRLQQVVINLILNARDAIVERAATGAAESRRGTIGLSACYLPASGKVVIVLQDDGTGISETALPRMFEPFFTTKPTGKGTGLGLSVSYQIIRQMGGTIVAENRPDRPGARFTITLDAAPAAASQGQSAAA